MDASFLVIFSGVLVSVAAILFALRGHAQRTRRRQLARIEALRTRHTGRGSRGKSGARPASLKREGVGQAKSMLDRIAVKLLPRPALLAARLARTGKRINPGTYLAINLATAVFVFFLVSGLFGFSPVLGALIAAGVGIGLPHITVGWLGNRRIDKFLALFPDAIDLIVRGLKSGLPITEGIQSAGAEIADPVGQEFREVADRVRLGQTLEDAIWESARRLNAADFNFFAISLGVQRETGGNLAETLANLSAILRKRKQMKLKVKAMSSEARASAYILGSLPFLMLAILFVLNSDYIMTLFTDPRGIMATGVGVGMLITGVLVMFKMVRFEA